MHDKIPFKKLTLAGTVGALMLVSNMASAHVSYNLAGDGSTGAAPADGENSTWSDGAPPSYVGNLPITWYAAIHNSGGVANSQTASYANAIADGVSNGIAVGARAYKDNATNWGHNADFALFKLEADATVTISVSNVLGLAADSNLRPAFGLWSGWDAGSGSRHGTYLNNGAINAMGANPFPGGDAGISVVDAGAWAFSTQGDATTSVTATLTRLLTAGNYTLAIGGYDGTSPGQKAYSATISAAASPVPIPAAAWLFGGALPALVGFCRRKKTV